jgi:uncharacterized protein (TIGR03435 family)
MLMLGEQFVTRRKRLLNAIRILAIAALGLIILTSAAQCRARSQNPSPSATTATYEYDAVTIKPSKGPGPDAKIGMWGESDGFNAWYVTAQQMVSMAYGVERFRILGGPTWLPSERFDIEAKMDAATSDALEKLNPNQRGLALQKMLQALLTDRFKLTIHRETRELLVYTLVVAKNGAKLQTAKLGNTYANGIKYPDGSLGGPGAMSGGVYDGWLTAQAVTTRNLAGELTSMLGHPVTDKTGLTGEYDFTLRFTPDDRLQPPGGAAPSERPAMPGSDSNEPSLFDAIQEQLGLKLDAGKGPVEIVVIDQVERPSGN